MSALSSGAIVIAMIRHTLNKQLVVTVVGQLNITVCGETWSDADWIQHVENTIAAATEANGSLGGLIYSPRSAPTAKQREAAKKMSPELFGESVSRVAILSDSALVRGAMVAVGWLSMRAAHIKPFRPQEVDAALTWLGQTLSFDRAEAVRLLQQMRELASI